MQTHLMILAILLAAAAGTPGAPSPPTLVAGAVSSPADACKNDKPDEVIVCGKPGERFRIDPNVLEADRAANALPAKPPAQADQAGAGGCVGPNSCKDGVIPLVGMALAAAKAAALAANGDDWRDAIRTHDDEYRLYKQAEERRRKDRGVKIGVSVGNAH
jgi:hypothetical protein